MSCMWHTPKGNHVARHGDAPLQRHTPEPSGSCVQEHASSTSPHGGGGLHETCHSTKQEHQTTRGLGWMMYRIRST